MKLLFCTNQIMITFCRTFDNFRGEELWHSVIKTEKLMVSTICLFMCSLKRI